MFWNKKEDKKLLPDLPAYRNPVFFEQSPDSTSDYDDNHDGLPAEKHELPSFPDSLSDKGFSQAAIKDAVGSDETLERVGASGEAKFAAVEMEEWQPSMKNEEVSQYDEEEKVVESIPLPPGKKYPRRRIEEPPAPVYDRDDSSRGRGKNSDIFVKLDKFYSARKALYDAQQKLTDVDALLRKIRDVKMREDQELSLWDKELNEIKTKINDIAINLFEKVD